MTLKVDGFKGTTKAQASLVKANSAAQSLLTSTFKTEKPSPLVELQANVNYILLFREQTFIKKTRTGERCVSGVVLIVGTELTPFFGKES